MNDLISVIVAVYNRPDALAAVLRSLSRQSDRNFEIVIADDGSGREVEGVIAAWAPRLGVPIRHVWQEDDGGGILSPRIAALPSPDISSAEIASCCPSA